MTDVTAELRKAIQTFNPELDPGPLLAMATLLHPDELAQAYIPTSSYRQQPHVGGLLATNRRLLHVLFDPAQGPDLAPQTRHSYDYQTLQGIGYDHRGNRASTRSRVTVGLSELSTRSRIAGGISELYELDTSIKEAPLRDFYNLVQTNVEHALSTPPRVAQPALDEAVRQRLDQEMELPPPNAQPSGKAGHVTLKHPDLPSPIEIAWRQLRVRLYGRFSTPDGPLWQHVAYFRGSTDNTSSSESVVYRTYLGEAALHRARQHHPARRGAQPERLYRGRYAEHIHPEQSILSVQPGAQALHLCALSLRGYLDVGLSAGARAWLNPPTRPRTRGTRPSPPYRPSRSYRAAPGRAR